MVHPLTWRVVNTATWSRGGGCHWRLRLAGNIIRRETPAVLVKIKTACWVYPYRRLHWWQEGRESSEWIEKKKFFFLQRQCLSVLGLSIVQHAASALIHHVASNASYSVHARFLFFFCFVFCTSACSKCVLRLCCGCLQTVARKEYVPICKQWCVCQRTCLQTVVCKVCVCKQLCVKRESVSLLTVVCKESVRVCTETVVYIVCVLGGGEENREISV